MPTARCESWYARGVWRPALLILVLVSCGRLGFDPADGASDSDHLVDGAPAIDGGTDLGLDMLPDQPARFLGSAPDLGAVESH
jgi:hypothetical protein